MKYKLLLLLFSFLFLLSLTSQVEARPQPAAATQLTPTPYRETVLDKKKMLLVTRVVDGDTIEISIRGKKEKVRLLAIDTPETVDPRKPVQCFGREAGDKMKSLVEKNM